MNKEELVTAVANKTKQSKKQTEAGIQATIEAISDALAKGDKVTLVGFGTFQVKERAAREGRNPRTGAVLKIAAKKSPSGSPSRRSAVTISMPSGLARVARTAAVWAKTSTSTARRFALPRAARCINVMASAAAVPSSSIEALATLRPVRSATIVWKFSSASSRPWLISGWYGV